VNDLADNRRRTEYSFRRPNPLVLAAHPGHYGAEPLAGAPKDLLVFRATPPPGGNAAYRIPQSAFVTRFRLRAV